uniref:Uncharacterized protein n=1 Tax=Arundo donax TaxID=35708 RepID=A0A0A9G0Q3_ARUDO
MIAETGLATCKWILPHVGYCFSIVNCSAIMSDFVVYRQHIVVQ